MTLRILVLVLLSFARCAGNIPKVDQAQLKPPEDFQLAVETLTEEKKQEAQEAAKPSKKPTKKIKTEIKPKNLFISEAVKDLTQPIPFSIGERTQYLLTYLRVKGGLITMEVRPQKFFEGRAAFHFWGNVISSATVNMFYKLDDSIDVLVDQQKFLPLRGSFDLKESAQLKQRIVLFKHGEKKAHFWSRRFSSKLGNEEVNRVDEMTEGAQDMFGALFYVRYLRPEAGRTIEFPVYENKQNWKLTVVGLNEESVETPIGRFDTVKSKLSIFVQGVLKQTGDIHMWTAKDAQSTLVKFSADIRIGSLKGTIVRRGSINDPLDLSM